MTVNGGSAHEASSKAGAGVFSVFREATISLVADAFGLVAGGTVATFYVSLVMARGWAVALYPIVLTTRGVINGVFAGRLSTALHTGLVKPSLFGNTRYYHALAASQVTLSLLMGILMGILTALTTGAPLAEAALILMACISIQALSLSLIDPVTSGLAFLVFKRGLDPDIVLYPYSSTIADIWATLSYVISLGMLLRLGALGEIIALAISVAMAAAVAHQAVSLRDEKVYWKTLREASLSVVATTIIAVASGYALSRVGEELGKMPGLITVYPALIDTMGDLAAMVGSSATTKLYLGMIDARMASIRRMATEIAQMWTAGLLFYLLYGLVASQIQGCVLPLAITMIVYGVFSAPIILLTFLVATLTFRRGLDPDNFVIPVETSITDALVTILTAALVYVLTS